MKNETKEKRTRQRTAKNRTTSGYRISDEMWAVLEPVVPVPVNPHRFGGGRRLDLRAVRSSRAEGTAGGAGIAAPSRLITLEPVVIETDADALAGDRIGRHLVAQPAFEQHQLAGFGRHH